MRARYVTTGLLALYPRAFGQEYDIKGTPTSHSFEECGSVAVIHVVGPLEQHPNWCFQDYETILAQAEDAFTSQCRAVALCINSPGGAAAGCFEAARALRAMSVDSGKPLGVFIDGMACSAAYALACSATAGIHAPPTSTVASLAVYEMIVDQTGADAALGMRFTFVPSTGADLKLTGNAHVTPSEAQVAHTQSQVDLLTAYFYGLVEEMRGVPESEIRALRGATLLATQGLDKGLVDVISDWNGFLATLETSKGLTTMGAQAKSAKSDEKDGEKSPFDNALAELAKAAAGDDDVAKAAKKMLAAHYGAESDDGDGDEPKKEPEAAKAEDEKKEPEAAAATSMQASASVAGGSNELALAKRVQELEARDAKRVEDARRAELFSKRPDFSAEVRKSLALAPLAVLEDAVKSWPRVSASPMAAAAASQPAATPGEKDGARPGIQPELQSVLDRFDRGRPQVTQAKVEGTSLVLDSNMSAEMASKRLAEMVARGMTPQGVPHDMARVANTEFKTPAK